MFNQHVHIFVKVAFIETEIEKLTTEQLIFLQDNIRLLFIKCIETFECQHQLRTIFSLKVICMFF